MASIGRPAMSASSTSDRISSCCPSSPMAIGPRLKALSRPIDPLAEDAHTGHYALMRRWSIPIALALLLTNSCKDEMAQEHCGAGAKCAPLALALVNSRSLVFSCMATTPEADVIGEAVDASARITSKGHAFSSVAHSVDLDGRVVPGIFILTPAEPVCATPPGAQSASGIAYDPTSDSSIALDRLLGR
jgi:hypothetical protein